MKTFKNILLSCLLFTGLFKNTAYCKAENNPAILNSIPPDSNDLKQALQSFINAADSGNYMLLIPFYDSGFVSIRVVDEGEFIKMDFKQMISFWNMQTNTQKRTGSFSHQSIINGKTTIYYTEVSGNTGNTILTRVKDFGKGAEPLFYDLTWIYKENKWLLFREIVHQRTMPSFH